MSNKVSRALMWDILGTFVSQGTGLIVSIFLARLLGPEEFGIVAIVLAIINILTIFTDFGFRQGLIQNKTNSQQTYSSVFYLNLALGLLLFSIFQLLASHIGFFYNNNIIEELIRYLSLLLIINALCSVQSAILVKNLLFKVLTVRLIVSRVIGGTIGIILAFQGYGVYALVWQELISVLINLVMLWKISEWRPSLVYSHQEIKKIFKFSIYVFLTQIINRIVSKLDVLLIGKLFSPTTLGYYGRSQSLMGLVQAYSSKSINSVFFPVLSKVQDNEKQFNEIFHKVYSIICFFVFLLAGILIFSAEFIIITLFGEKWLPSVTIFQILMFKIYSFPINSFLITSIISKGKSEENFFHSIVRNFLKSTTYIVAIFYGFRGFLIALVMVSVIGTIYNNIISSYYLKTSLKKQFNELLSFGTIFLGILLLVNYLKIPIENILLITIIKTTCFMFFYLLLSYFLKKSSIKVIYEMFFHLFSK